MQTIFYIIIFLFSFFSGYGCSQTAPHSTNTSSQDLNNLCKKFDKKEAKGEVQKRLTEIQHKCCQNSVKIIKKHSYQVLSSHQAACPKGTQENMMKNCIGSLRWCEPKTGSSSPYIPLEKLDDHCEIIGGCCKGTLEFVKKHSYLVLREDIPDDGTACPKGTKRNRKRCKGSLIWCHPENK